MPSTASEWLANTPGDIQGLEEVLIANGVSVDFLTEYPDWMKQEVANNLVETFKQPYWDDIHKSFLGDAEKFLDVGLRDGKSIVQMANEIAESFAGQGSAKYAKIRATAIARTECLPGDTIVDGAKVVAAYRRWYSGPFIEIITEAGRKFAGTPNHPMLTLRGWVGLGDLQKSDSLVCYNRSIEQSGTSGNEYIETPPSTISEIFDSLSAVGIFERRLGTNPDFHGDGMDSDVDVFTTDGELSYGCFVPVEESGIENILSEPDLGKLLLVAKSNSFPRGISKFSSFGCCAGFMSRIGNGSYNTGRINIKCFCNRNTGFSSFVSGGDFFKMNSSEVFGESSVACRKHQLSSFAAAASRNIGLFASSQDDTCVALKEFGDLNTTHTGQIEIDHPLTIRRIESWNGHVFNLTTRDGYFNIADGVYTGNSGHALNGARKAGMDRLTSDPQLMGTMRPVWLSVLGTTTRDSHANLDGVPADKNGMWNLSGYEIPWPSHISLPPEQRINCMCTIVMELGMQDQEATDLIGEYNVRVEEENKVFANKDNK